MNETRELLVNYWSHSQHRSSPSWSRGFTRSPIIRGLPASLLYLFDSVKKIKLSRKIHSPIHS